MNIISVILRGINCLHVIIWWKKERMEKSMAKNKRSGGLDIRGKWAIIISKTTTSTKMMMMMIIMGNWWLRIGERLHRIWESYKRGGEETVAIVSFSIYCCSRCWMRNWRGGIGSKRTTWCWADNFRSEGSLESRRWWWGKGVCKQVLLRDLLVDALFSSSSV